MCFFKQDRKSETTSTGVLELGINFLDPMMVESVARYSGGSRRNMSQESLSSPGFIAYPHL